MVTEENRKSLGNFDNQADAQKYKTITCPTTLVGEFDKEYDRFDKG